MSVAAPNIIVLFIILAIVILPIILIGKAIYNNRHDKKKVITIILSITVVIFVFKTLINFYASNNLPRFGYAPKEVIKQHTMKLNEKKSIEGTTIIIKNAILDLNSIGLTYSVTGKSKVVAADIKKSLQDEKTLNSMEGLWVGKTFGKEENSVGFSYDAEEFINPLCLTFHLSDGNSITFEIKDTTGIKEKTEIIKLNETIKFNNDKYIKITKIKRAVQSLSIGFESDIYSIKDVIETKIIIDGKEYDRESYGYAGGGSKYQGSFAFKPIESSSFKIKIVNTTTKEEKILEIN